MGSFTKLTYHVVFGTKFRRPLITGNYQDRLYEYIGGIIRVVQDYIRNQEDHHCKRTFEDEFIAILKRHDIAFEPRFLFEAEHHG